MPLAPTGTSRRTVTVLFCDIVDSTSFSERLDVETHRHVQASYFDAVANVVARHGGIVEKFIGDAVMAVFGLPRLHEDDALRALRAASELNESVRGLDQMLARDHGLELRLRVGVSTGEVVAGDPSDAQAFATGETVVVAERLERAAQPGHVLVAENTYQLASGAAMAEPAGPISVKGMAEPVVAWRLLGVRDGVPAIVRRLDRPIVGRGDELNRLRSAFDDVVDNRLCRLVLVVGPAGIGKSRLVREFVDLLDGAATVRSGQCPSYGSGITFWPVADVLPDETFEGTTNEIFMRVRNEFEALACERPLVVCFEDVHLGEPTFLDLIEYLVGWIADAPVLIVCTARPQLLERMPHAGAGAIALDALSADEVDDLLAVLGASTEVRRRIAEAAEGNPLFIEQLTALAAEKGGDVVVPPSVRLLLAARIDDLTADERAAIERCAVIGREFSLRAAGALMDFEVTGALLSLVRKGLLHPAGSEDTFAFQHALIREEAYEAVPKALRADLHERHARWLAAHDGAEVVVGFHLEKAFRLRSELGPAEAALGQEAGELLALAADRAYLRNDVPAAVTLFGRALELLSTEFPARARLLGALGTVLVSAGRLDEAGEALDEAIRLARQTGDTRTELRAIVERQQLRSMTEPAGAVAEIGRVAEQVMPVLEEMGDDVGLAKTWRLISDASVFACRWRQRAEALERAIDHARRAPEARPAVSVFVGLLADALHYGPTPASEAIVRCERFLEEAGDDLALRAAVTATRGALVAMQGRFGEARTAYAESVDIHERLGLKMRRVAFSTVGAQIALLEGDLATAEVELRFAYDELERMGERGLRAVVSAQLADALLAQGNLEDAGTFARAAAALAEPEDVAAQVLHRTVQARLGARAGSLPSAERLAREATALAAATDFLALQGFAALGLADVLQHAGQHDEAGLRFAEARERYEQKGDLAAARRLSSQAQGVT